MQQGDSNRSLRSAERSRTEELSRYLTLADDDDAVLAGGVVVRPGYEDFSIGLRHFHGASTSERVPLLAVVNERTTRFWRVHNRKQ